MFQDTLKLLVRILRSPGCRKFPVLVKSADDVILAATKFVSERLCPIFQVQIQYQILRRFLWLSTVP